mgnify:CR=1 FL=1
MSAHDTPTTGSAAATAGSHQAAGSLCAATQGEAQGTATAAKHDQAGADHSARTDAGHQPHGRNTENACEIDQV